MFFHFIGIKDISEKNYTLDLLIQANDINIVKDFLNDQKAITLGLTPYEGNPESFGSVFILIQHANDQLKIITQFENIESCLHNIIPLQLSILEVNDLKNPISHTESQSYIAKHQTNYEEQHKKHLAQKAKDESQDIKKSDPRLKKAYDAIEEIINQIEQLQSIGGEKIEPITRKKLEDMRGNISKLRLATNYDKIIEELHNAMNLIVTTQDFLLERLTEDKIYPIFSETQVQNVEVIREQTRLAKAQLLQALGAELSREESMYVSLGYLKLFAQYFQKDITFALQNKIPIRNKFCKALEVTALFLIIEFAILLIIAPMLKLSFDNKNFAIALLYISPFALLIGAFNHKISPKTQGEYLIWLVGILSLYIAIIAFLRMLLLF